MLVAQLIAWGDQLLSCLFIAVTTRAGNQILAKLLHLYGCFLYLLSIFVALPRRNPP